MQKQIERQRKSKKEADTEKKAARVQKTSLTFNLIPILFCVFCFCILI